MKTTSTRKVTQFQKLSSHTDEQLVDAAKSGDQLAFTELWHRYCNRVYGFLWRITRNHEDAEDALQESFMKAFVHLRGFDGRSQFSTWMTRIALTTALMILRRRRARPSISLDSFDDYSCPPQFADSGAHPEANYCGRELRSALHQAVHGLPAILRDVLKIQLLREIPIKEVAAEANITVAAAKTRLMRARGAVRKSMQRRGQL
jgi:RNA polymerase sigma-70 factor (ECF subfamily)